METVIANLVGYIRDISTIIAFAALIIKPLREKVFGLESLKEGLRSLLRAEIVRIYYRHHDDKQLREYEYKNLISCYAAYKALGGNSFIEHIYAEMQEWEII